MNTNSKSPTRRENLIVAGLLLSISVVLAFNYFSAIDLGNVPKRMHFHRAIINGTADPGLANRVLVPFVVDQPIKLLSHFVSPRKAFVVSYGVFDLFAIAFSLWMLYSYVRLWFDWQKSLIGVMFVAATMGLTFRDHFFHPWSLLELGMFAYAFALLYRGKFTGFCVLTVLAMLNRGTALWLPVVYAATTLGAIRAGSKRTDANAVSELVRLAVCFVLAGAVFFGVRHLRPGAAPNPLDTDSTAFLRNMSNIPYSVFLNVAFAGALWVYAAMGFRYAPPFVRRTAIIVPLHLAAAATTYWPEVRNLVVLHAVLIPLGLSFIFRDETPGLARDTGARDDQVAAGHP